jgi:large-conductance mechanosensitive channel
VTAKRWAGLVALVLVIVSVVLWHGRFSADFYPLDSSRVGPNLVASVVQWAIIALVVYLAYPPVRKAIDRAVKKHTDELHEKLDKNAKLLRHVIEHHPEIPNKDRDGVDLTK